MTYRTIGIDPGLSGAVAILPAGVVSDTPTAVTANGKTRRHVYLPGEMARIVREYATGDCHAYLEAVHSMPGQGVRSMFSMGHGLGLWEGILAALGVPYTLVTPQRWKREMMGSVTDKDAARVRAVQLFPHLAGELARVKDHGRAEALLIAEYGLRTGGSGGNGLQPRPLFMRGTAL